MAVELEQLNQDGTASGRKVTIPTQGSFDFGEVPGNWVYKITLLGSIHGSMADGHAGHAPHEAIWHGSRTVSTYNLEYEKTNSIYNADFLLLTMQDYHELI